jgi:mycothiol synthase
MSNFRYTIRNYRPEDIEAFVRLLTESRPPGHSAHPPHPEAIAERLNRPGHSPEKDLFLVETNGQPIGYMDIQPELPSQRVILSGWIHPYHRRQGLATRLLDHARKRAAELKVRTIRVSIPRDNTAAEQTLLKLGFRRAREYFHLQLDTAGRPLPGTEETTVSFRPLQPDELALFTRLQNRCFAGAWEFNPNTVEEVAHEMASPFVSPQDIRLAWEGDRLTGYCWTGFFPGAAEPPPRGQIFMLGVDPEYRGRGMGRTILLAGIAHLIGKGTQVIELMVDSQNHTARALYESIGFKERSATVWYEKTLD